MAKENDRNDIPHSEIRRMESEGVIEKFDESNPSHKSLDMEYALIDSLSQERDELKDKVVELENKLSNAISPTKYESLIKLNQKLREQIPNIKSGDSKLHIEETYSSERELPEVVDREAPKYFNDEWNPTASDGEEHRYEFRPNLKAYNKGRDYDV